MVKAIDKTKFLNLIFLLACLAEQKKVFKLPYYSHFHLSTIFTFPPTLQWSSLAQLIIQKHQQISREQHN